MPDWCNGLVAFSYPYQNSQWTEATNQHVQNKEYGRNFSNQNWSWWMMYQWIHDPCWSLNWCFWGCASLCLVDYPGQFGWWGAVSSLGTRLGIFSTAGLCWCLAGALHWQLLALGRLRWLGGECIVCWSFNTELGKVPQSDAGISATHLHSSSGFCSLCGSIGILVGGFDLSCIGQVVRHDFPAARH